MLEEEELGNVRSPILQKMPQPPRLASTGTQCSESHRADQCVISYLMQIARPNQEVISADKRALQADVSNSGTSRPSRLNSIHQIIASSFISACFFRPNTAFWPCFTESKILFAGVTSFITKFKDQNTCPNYDNSCPSKHSISLCILLVLLFLFKPNAQELYVYRVTMHQNHLLAT